MFEIIALLFATYYIVTVLTRSSGYKGFLFKLRQKDSNPLHCEMCLAIWVAVPVYLVWLYLPHELLMPVVIAGAFVALRDFIDWYDA